MAPGFAHDSAELVAIDRSLQQPLCDRHGQRRLDRLRIRWRHRHARLDHPPAQLHVRSIHRAGTPACATGRLARCAARRTALPAISSLVRFALAFYGRMRLGDRCRDRCQTVIADRCGQAVVRQTGSCDPWRDAHGSRHVHHGFSCGPESRAYACGGSPKVERCVS